MRISDWSSDVCSSDLPEEKRQELIQKRAKLASLVDEMPSFKDDIAKIDAALNGVGTAGIAWKELVSALASEPPIGMLPKVWDLDRRTLYQDNREPHHPFLMLRNTPHTPRHTTHQHTFAPATH